MGVDDDKVSPREMGAITERVHGVEKTLTQFRESVDKGLNKINDTMDGLVSQDQHSKLDTKVDNNKKELHARISSFQWKVISACGTVTLFVVGWLVKAYLVDNL